MHFKNIQLLVKLPAEGPQHLKSDFEISKK